MSKKRKNDNLILWVVIALVGILVLKGGYLGALVDPQVYNGDMEDWCINTGEESGYGDGCDASNSIPVLGTTYDGTHTTNQIPQMWGLKYGCCTLQSTDAYEGSYSAQIHKESTDDWYGFGMTRGSEEKFSIPATQGRTYTLTAMYKFSLSSGRNPSLSVRFFDSDWNELFRQSSSFSVQTEWTQLTDTATAPSGTAYLGWDIWFPSETIADLWIDNLEIDEADACAEGDTFQCGTDEGTCEFGTQTCDSNGMWGPCTGGTNPSQEICDNNLDDDCDSQTDENCNIQSYTNTELVVLFDEYNMNTYDGLGYSHSSSPTWWAWDNAPIVEAQINMYLYTRDTKYLDLVVTNTDRLISKASDYDNDGLLDWEALESPIDPILTYSRNLLPMAKFAYVVKENGLTAYDAKADEYIAFIDNNFMPLYESIWHECGPMGFWTEGTASAPNNRASFVGRTHLYMYFLTDNPVYLDHITKYAEKVKSTLLLKTDGPSGAEYYTWNYANKAGCTTVDGEYVCSYDCEEEGRDSCDTNPGSWTCVGPAETSYTNYDTMLMLDLYEAGIVFDNTDLHRLINTFKEGILVDPAEVDGVPTPAFNWKIEYEPPTNLAGHNSIGGSPHWGRFGHYDQTIKSVFAQRIAWTVNNNAGDYYSFPYLCVNDLRGDYGEICAEGEDFHRSTPAYTMSSIAHQLLDYETFGSYTPPPASCGDGTVNQASEECDDGNNVNNDGCSSDCLTEVPVVNLHPDCDAAGITTETECIDFLAGEISDQASTISEQADEIDNLNADVATQAALILELQNTPSDQADLIDELELTINEQATLLASMDISVSDKQKIIDELELTVTEKTELIKLLEQKEADKPTQANWLILLLGAAAVLLMFNQKKSRRKSR